MVDEDGKAGLGAAASFGVSDEFERPRVRKAADAFRTISEVADELHVPQHVLRFWEGKFPQVRPLKRGGGRRYYRPEDVALLRRVADLLYTQGYTIKGVQRLLRDTQKHVAEPHVKEPAYPAVEPQPVAVTVLAEEDFRADEADAQADELEVMVQDIVEPALTPILELVAAEQEEVRRLRQLLTETLTALEELRALIG